ncbi:MAG: hypothetical protein WDO69_32595 [Pseudomonadota bacterium]
MKYLDELKHAVVRIGGDGRFQIDEYLTENITPLFAEMLLSEAALFGPPTTVLTDAPARGCHENCLNYVMSKGGDPWSGFALNAGVWRVHSWVVENGAIVEASPFACERYVGVAINTRERVAACFPQAGEPLPAECSKRVSS